MSDIRLKPCPVCGDFNVEYDVVDCRVYCCDCGTSGPHYCDGEEAAAEAWNKLPRLLRWTTEPPTEPGWYFSRVNSIVNVVLLGGSPEGLCVLDGEKLCPINGFSHSNRRVEWAGPIPEPTEPKEDK